MINPNKDCDSAYTGDLIKKDAEELLVEGVQLLAEYIVVLKFFLNVSSPVFENR